MAEMTLNEKISVAHGFIEFALENFGPAKSTKDMADLFKREFAKVGLIITPGFDPISDKHKDGELHLIKVNYTDATIVEQAHWNGDWVPLSWRLHGGGGVRESIVDCAMPIPMMEEG